jgi:putative chitinase
MTLSKAQLKNCMPYATAQNIERFIQPLNDAMQKYGITTPERVACFLAQLAHESACLRYTKEIATGKAYDTGKLATDLGNTPEADGDGQKYKGRGLIQITGTYNYKALAKEFGVDFTSNPELLEGPVYASLSAGWFWQTRRLNELADKMDFKTITKRINGGLNGYEDRLKYFELAKKEFSI